MDIKTALKTVIERQNLSYEQMSEVMNSIMTGEATPSQIAGFMIGLRMKGETVDEISAAAQVMRNLAAPVKLADQQHLVDIVGTGGDGTHTFNISTTSAFVVAAAGGKVAKHGNRSVSSSSGSADVLEALGVKLSITPQQVAECVDKIGIGFMFAPQHHSAMKHAITPRKEMGVRTVFNLLGPLTNPAGAPNQLLGVYDKEWLEPLALVLQRLGSEHVLLIHAEDGLDEISIASPTYVTELHHDKITSYTVSPEQLGLSRASLDQIQVESVEQSVDMVRTVLSNQTSAARDIVLLNAGAAIYAANLVGSLEQGVRLAHNVIRSGEAQQKLDALVQLTQSFH
ncbi:anthranilate phosphoribosyltransferase [Candidatus Albibeggiatoa sp. nov. NOAA]|uniref:anthranilate phosphoribosyltransferase n=1 Tax=Candidatus Albibeggiatoa sp. nov. NOAA TaxID=3162724 RepID=UPI0032F76AE9|nr:anthranilate phosphoribosyltransferase [Thiotrichaceae bacterium]